MDEIPFDFERRLLSVVLRPAADAQAHPTLICKVGHSAFTDLSKTQSTAGTVLNVITVPCQLRPKHGAKKIVTIIAGRSGRAVGCLRPCL